MILILTQHSVHNLLNSWHFVLLKQAFVWIISELIPLTITSKLKKGFYSDLSCCTLYFGTIINTDWNKTFCFLMHIFV